MPAMGGDVTVSYGVANQNAANNKPASVKTSATEMAARVNSGPFLVSVAQVTKKETPNESMSAAVAGTPTKYELASNGNDSDGSTNDTVVSKAGTKFAKQTTNKVAKQKGSEFEVAYTASDALTVNLVYFSAKVEEGANADDKFSSTLFGAKYTIAPGLYVSLSRTSFKYTAHMDTASNNKGNGTRLRVNVDL